MKQRSLQFHALPSEIAEWISDWSKQYDFHIGVVFYGPRFRVRLVKSLDPKRFASDENADEIWLRIKPIDLDFKSKSQAQALNEDAFVILCPHQGSDCLREVIAGSGATSLRAFEQWANVLKDIKRRCSSGLWVTNPVMRICRFYKTAKYSPGAASLSRRGVPLLPIAGDNTMSIIAPSTSLITPLSGDKTHNKLRKRTSKRRQ